LVKLLEILSWVQWKRSPRPAWSRLPGAKHLLEFVAESRLSDLCAPHRAMVLAGCVGTPSDNGASVRKREMTQVPDAPHWLRRITCVTAPQSPRFHRVCISDRWCGGGRACAPLAVPLADAWCHHTVWRAAAKRTSQLAVPPPAASETGSSE
jgi:hypothetical protein